MKKTIIAFNEKHILESNRRFRKDLENVGYSEDKFPMEVNVLDDGFLDTDGRPYIRSVRGVPVAQYWFIFKED